MSSHPNNSPAEKAAWERNKPLCRWHSRFIEIVPPGDYNPPKKTPSRRDRRRAAAAAWGAAR